MKVDIAERKFDSAETTARAVASEAAGAESLNDARALAVTLHAERSSRAATRSASPRRNGSSTVRQASPR
ncbi:MAG: hypothetical protein HC813_02510 [Planctomycetes bacterium]|nr:hypothetical protein [Planctomycetota bacterium]